MIVGSSPIAVTWNNVSLLSLEHSCLPQVCLLWLNSKNYFTSSFLNVGETVKFLKWLSKAIIVINWFSGDVQAGIIVAEHLNKCKGIK